MLCRMKKQGFAKTPVKAQKAESVGFRIAETDRKIMEDYFSTLVVPKMLCSISALESFFL